MHILLGGSQHAQFILADNADMDVTEITAALGCKFVYFTELQINLPMSCVVTLIQLLVVKTVHNEFIV